MVSAGFLMEFLLLRQKNRTSDRYRPGMQAVTLLETSPPVCIYASLKKN